MCCRRVCEANAREKPVVVGGSRLFLIWKNRKIDDDGLQQQIPSENELIK